MLDSAVRFASFDISYQYQSVYMCDSLIRAYACQRDVLDTLPGLYSRPVMLLVLARRYP